MRQNNTLLLRQENNIIKVQEDTQGNLRCHKAVVNVNFFGYQFPCATDSHIKTYQH